jgi:hypothetical protein
VPWDPLLGVAAGLVIATLTSPVGISGAVFLLPVQLSILQVPSPSVTPTNLLFNVVAVPGALARYRTVRAAGGTLTRDLLIGTIPGVIIGAFVRVYLLPGGTSFRFIVGLFLLPLGVWLAAKPPSYPSGRAPLPLQVVRWMAAATGVVGGLYGIGGGSLLSPILVGSGFAIETVAPAALASTFVTSCVGALTFGFLDLAGQTSAGPHWGTGLACGAGGLVGGYLGAALQPRLPKRALRRLLGLLAVGLAVAYLVAAAHA